MTRPGSQIEDDVRIARAATVVSCDSGTPCDSAAGTGVHAVGRIARIVGGATLLAVGGALLVLPRPGQRTPSAARTDDTGPREPTCGG
jgi:hypothetical protein